MAFKREKIRRSLLDEMEKTMSVIPMSELMLMIGEYGAGYYPLNNKDELDTWLSEHMQDPNYVEAVFYFFEDGTVGAYISTKNTSDMAVVSHGNHLDYYGHASFSGKIFTSWGHTHTAYSTPTVYLPLTEHYGEPDDISTKINVGVNNAAYIYYQGSYYQF